MSFQYKLNNILGKATGGKKVVMEEVKFAEDFVLSENVEVAISAILILLVVGDQKQNALAKNRLLRVCEQGLCTQTSLATTLSITALEYLSKKEITSNQCYLIFTYKTARHPCVSARLNALRILSRFAEWGDNDAIGVLQHAQDDSDASVSKAAKMALKRL